MLHGGGEAAQKTASLDAGDRHPQRASSAGESAKRALQGAGE